MRTRHALGAALGAALVVIALSASPALAWVEISKTGNTGQFFMPDPSTAGGAVCSYTRNGYQLGSIKVKGPAIYARDRSAARNSQYVGSRYIIQRRTGASFTDLYTSPIVKKLAYDDQPTAFDARTYTVASPMGQYRVRVQLIWYKASDASVQEGNIVLGLLYYRSVQPSTGDQRVDYEYCIQDY